MVTFPDIRNAEETMILNHLNDEKGSPGSWLTVSCGGTTHSDKNVN